MYLKNTTELLKSKTNDRASVIKYDQIRRGGLGKNSDKSKVEVACYTAYLDVVQTFHQSLKCSNWYILDGIEAPLEPVHTRYNETLLKKEIEAYRPTLFEKVLKKDKEKIASLKDRLPYEVNRDNEAYYKAIENFTSMMRRFDALKSCFKGIKDKNLRAYLYWLEETSPFSELEQYGILSKFYFEEDLLTIQLNHNNINIIPLNEQRLVSDQVVVTKMSVDKRKTIQKQIISSATVRAAREVFAALPVTKVVIKSFLPRLDEAILAVVFKRGVFEQLNVVEDNPLTIIHKFDHTDQWDVHK